MSIRSLRIDRALRQLVQRPTSSEFSQKYLENRYHIHSAEAIKEFKHNIEVLLTTKLDEKRMLAAVAARRFLLRENDMEDWSELADQLTNKEIQSDFWPHYRDHTAHQVLTFLLGAYLYENIPALRLLFKKQYSKGSVKKCDPLRTGFYYQWSTAALLHDFGYFLDVEKDKADSGDERRRTVLNQFYQRIDDYLQNYIMMVFRMGRRTPLSDAETDALLNLRNILGHGSVKHSYTRREDFVLLGRFVGSSHIARGAADAWELLSRSSAKQSARFEGVFENYFRILATQGLPTQNGPLPVWDHGIGSAVLFLKLSVFCWSYFDAVRNLSDILDKFPNPSRAVIREVAERIKKWDYSEEAFHGSFLLSCLAMAAHNLRHLARSHYIDQAGYTSSDIHFLKKVSSEVLPIRVTDGVVPYLLMIVDQLQDWDRYPIVRTGDKNVLNLLESGDISVAAKGGRVEFRFDRRCHARRDCILEDLNLLTADWRQFIRIS